mmetsp:Transcript_15973/g.53483  ORF Transcript_15973/g.53483 Transcript_15973/m.53483 type:complete len:259 (-) Transcript_15973:482-1258(-)
MRVDAGSTSAGRPPTHLEAHEVVGCLLLQAYILVAVSTDWRLDIVDILPPSRHRIGTELTASREERERVQIVEPPLLLTLPVTQHLLPHDSGSRWRRHTVVPSPAPVRMLRCVRRSTAPKEEVVGADEVAVAPLAILTVSHVGCMQVLLAVGGGSSEVTPEHNEVVGLGLEVHQGEVLSKKAQELWRRPVVAEHVRLYLLPCQHLVEQLPAYPSLLQGLVDVKVKHAHRLDLMHLVRRSISDEQMLLPHFQDPVHRPL